MYSNGFCNKLHVGQNLSDTFLGQNGVKQLDVLSPLLFNPALEYAVTKDYCFFFFTFPSSGILETRKHDVSETGSVSVLR
jgi:hypothetical protein